SKIPAEFERVCPGKCADDADGESCTEQPAPRIMMAHRGHAAPQILESAAKQTVLKRYVESGANRLLEAGVYIPRPVPGRTIWSFAEPRETVELQMVVGIDQAGEDQIAAAIHGAPLRETADRPYRTGGNRQIPQLGSFGRYGDAGVAQNHAFLHIATKI